MCGFVGLLQRPGAGETELLHWAEVMSATLVHRGPDDAGQWAEPVGGISFGFRRLAIIDLSPNGHQPMRSASGRYTLVFNGEVFNHRELRQELTGSGATFRGHSDTEVILAAFERWGTVILGLVILAISAWMNRGARKPWPYRQAGTIALAFLALAPGFGVQYLAWLVPFVAGIGPGASVLFHAASGAFLFRVYTFWCGGFPWDHADSNRAGDWGGGNVPYELACWLSVVLALAVQARSIAREDQPPPQADRSARARLA